MNYTTNSKIDETHTRTARLAAIPIDDFGLLISPLLIIIFLVIDILFSVFFLKNAHYCKTTTTLVVKKFFHPKSKPRKTCSSKLGIIGRIKTNKTTRPTVAAAAPHTKPRFYSYVPFDDSVFLKQEHKETTKKEFLFSVLFILKKKGKKFKRKKNFLANYCISLDDYFFDHFNYKYAMTFFECI